MNDDIMPKIFISYSWSSDDFVVPLAERLREHGVDVVLDKWDLKEGQDKYAYMEKCVNDPDITKVLIICDKAYVDKANGRKGGVGDETAIISSEVYGNAFQEKFIPIVIEHDVTGKACVPTYIKNRIYIDFSDDASYEDNYEKLLRTIYEKPLYRKPKLGKKPEWLDDETVPLFPIKDLTKQIKDAKSEDRAEKLNKDYLTKYIETLKDFYDSNRKSGEDIYKTFTEMKEVRDAFLDFLEVITFSGKELGDTLAGFFERAYNTLTSKETFDPDVNFWFEDSVEIYRIFLWELFICVTAYLLKKEDYTALNRMLTNTYFVKSLHSYTSEGTADYTAFRHHSHPVENEYKPQTESKQKYTMLGDCICNQREKKPVYTKSSLAEADLFLFQVYKALDIKVSKTEGWRGYWFPTLYVYVDQYNKISIWSKLKSKRFANKICELLGVDSIDELKKRVENCKSDRDMRYNNCFESAPAITAFINPEDIATLN